MPIKITGAHCHINDTQLKHYALFIYLSLFFACWLHLLYDSQWNPVDFSVFKWIWIYAICIVLFAFFRAYILFFNTRLLNIMPYQKKKKKKDYKHFTCTVDCVAKFIYIFCLKWMKNFTALSHKCFIKMWLLFCLLVAFLIQQLIKFRFQFAKKKIQTDCQSFTLLFFWSFFKLCCKMYKSFFHSDSEVLLYWSEGHELVALSLWGMLKKRKNFHCIVIVIGCFSSFFLTIKKKEIDKRYISA